MSLSSLRLCRTHPILCAYGIFFIVFSLWYFQVGIRTTWAIMSLPFIWGRHAAEYRISAAGDGFDLSFANYSRLQETALPEYPDQIPAVLHHIALGGAQPRPQWLDARQSCLELHSTWEAHLWTDEEAGTFVAEHFPDFKHAWDGYRYPIQRIDALRYLVLYHYGGVVLDMDLKCTRSLGPLRRFSFVAPAAHPTGFSIGFMMASKHNAFVGELVRNLKVYNRHWFGLPYPTVMFSTGCHYASTIHALQVNRTDLKILAGPDDNFKLHSLNGPVSTPIFDHLGSSSWHSYDASLIVSVGKLAKWRLPLFIAGVLCAVFLVMRFQFRGTLRRLPSYKTLRHGEKSRNADFENRMA